MRAVTGRADAPSWCVYCSEGDIVLAPTAWSLHTMNRLDSHLPRPNLSSSPLFSHFLPPSTPPSVSLPTAPSSFPFRLLRISRIPEHLEAESAREQNALPLFPDCHVYFWNSSPHPHLASAPSHWQQNTQSGMMRATDVPGLLLREESGPRSQGKEISSSRTGRVQNTNGAMICTQSGVRVGMNGGGRAKSTWGEWWHRARRPVVCLFGVNGDVMNTNNVVGSVRVWPCLQKTEVGLERAWMSVWL